VFHHSEDPRLVERHVKETPGRSTGFTTRRWSSHSINADDIDASQTAAMHSMCTRPFVEDGDGDGDGSSVWGMKAIGGMCGPGNSPGDTGGAYDSPRIVSSPATRRLVQVALGVEEEEDGGHKEGASYVQQTASKWGLPPLGDLRKVADAVTPGEHSLQGTPILAVTPEDRRRGVMERGNTPTR
jgi:hypothetical protein